MSASAGKFKVGDRVEVKDHPYSIPKNSGVIASKSPESLRGKWRVTLDDYGGDSLSFLESEMTLVPTLRIEAGRFYKTRDGRKVGPMVRNDDSWECGKKGWVGKLWLDSGRRYFGDHPETNIVAEWVEPAVAGATAKFKVGDRVENAIPGNDYENDGTVTKIVGDTYRVAWDNSHWFDDSLEWRGHELRLVAPATSGNAIVALIENGQPKPSDRPFVHGSRNAAEAEAARTAGKHPGKEFGVYELVATKREAKVYDFEWQRLAVEGQKIEAIKALRGITGVISLRSAKQAVEDFVEREAA